MQILLVNNGSLASALAVESENNNPLAVIMEQHIVDVNICSESSETWQLFRLKPI